MKALRLEIPASGRIKSGHMIMKTTRKKLKNDLKYKWKNTSQPSFHYRLQRKSSRGMLHRKAVKYKRFETLLVIT